MHRFSQQVLQRLLAHAHAALPPEKAAETKPDYVPVLRWNLRDAMMLSSVILASGAPIRHVNTPRTVGHLVGRLFTIPRSFTEAARTAEAALLGRSCPRHRDWLL